MNKVSPSFSLITTLTILTVGLSKTYMASYIFIFFQSLCYLLCSLCVGSPCYNLRNKKAISRLKHEREILKIKRLYSFHWPVCSCWLTVNVWGSEMQHMLQCWTDLYLTVLSCVLTPLPGPQRSQSCCCRSVAGATAPACVCGCSLRSLGGRERKGRKQRNT